MRTSKGLGWAVLGIMAAASLGALAFGGMRIREYRERRAWTEVPGVVLMAEGVVEPPEAHDPQGEGRAFVRLRYRYAAGGREWVRDETITSLPLFSSPRDLAGKIKADPVVLVNPKDPGQASMDRGLPWTAAAMLLCGLGGCAVVGWVLVMMRRRPAT